MIFLWMLKASLKIAVRLVKIAVLLAKWLCRHGWRAAVKVAHSSAGRKIVVWVIAAAVAVAATTQALGSTVGRLVLIAAAVVALAVLGVVLRHRDNVLARFVRAQTRNWHPIYRLRGGKILTATQMAEDGARMAALHVDVEKLLSDPHAAVEYGRVPLGFMDAKHSPVAPRATVSLAAPKSHHVVVMAQTGAGKTDAFTLPAVLSPSLAKTCMVVVDPTGGLLNRTMAYRAQCGRVSVYDPSNDLRLPELSAHWSPLGALNRAADVTELEDRCLATALDLVGSQDDAGTTNSKFFALTATSLLRCLLLAAVWDQREFTDVMRWVSAAASPDKLDEVESILADYVDRAGGDPEVLDAWGGFRTLGPDRLSERFATAQANLLAFSFSSVKRSSNLSDPRRAFNSREFLRQPGTHYVVGSSKASERLMGLYVAHLTEIIQEAIDEAKRLKRLHGQDTVLPYQLVLLLEEVAQLASLPNLPNLLSEVRQYGIRIFFVFQDYSQVLKKYGPHGAANIMNNAGTQLFLGGQNDEATKKLLRDMGQAWLTERTTHADADGTASGHNESRRQQDLLPLHILPNLPQGKAILFSTGSRPAEITTRFWKNHRDLVARVETPVEAFAADNAAGLVHTPVWPDDPDMTPPEAAWRELSREGVRRRQAERDAGVAAAQAHFAAEDRPRPTRARASSAARVSADGWEDAADVSFGDEPDEIRFADADQLFDDPGAGDVCHDGRPVILVDPMADTWAFADTGEYLDGPPNRVA